MNAIARLLFVVLVLFGTLAPTSFSRAAAAGAGDALELSDLGSAKTAFGKIGGNMKALAWYVLLLLVVIAGVMAAFGQQRMAVGVFIGAIIVAGGTYIIGVLATPV